jgi:nucleoside-triphosphatase THEP1
MPEKNIYILTAPIQSGKTTSLINWSTERKDVCGILTPVFNNKRMFMNIATGQLFAMEAGYGETATLTVGRFIFSQINFNNAIQIIREAIHTPGWLVIDEIGPLELNGQGFHDVLKEVLMQRKNKLVLVVRKGLAEKVNDYFMLDATFVNSFEEI